MIRIDKGSYVVELVRPGHGATVVARCHFCNNEFRVHVPSTAVNPTRLVLNLQCRYCDVKESYVPQA